MPAHVLVRIEFGGQLSGVRSLLPLCGFRDQTLASSPALPVFTYCIDSKNPGPAYAQFTDGTAVTPPW